MGTAPKIAHIAPIVKSMGTNPNIAQTLYALDVGKMAQCKKDYPFFYCCDMCEKVGHMASYCPLTFEQELLALPDIIHVSTYAWAMGVLERYEKKLCNACAWNEVNGQHCKEHNKCKFVKGKHNDWVCVIQRFHEMKRKLKELYLCLEEREKLTCVEKFLEVDSSIDETHVVVDEHPHMDDENDIDLVCHDDGMYMMMVDVEDAWENQEGRKSQEELADSHAYVM